MAAMVRLTPQQESWLEARVAKGEFGSVEQGALRLLDDCMAEAEDDLLWARPLLEEAYADIARGDVVSLEEHQARNRTRFADLKR